MLISEIRKTLKSCHNGYELEKSQGLYAVINKSGDRILPLYWFNNKDITTKTLSHALELDRLINHMIDADYRYTLANDKNLELDPNAKIKLTKTLEGDYITSNGYIMYDINGICFVVEFDAWDNSIDEILKTCNAHFNYNIKRITKMLKSRGNNFCPEI